MLLERQPDDSFSCLWDRVRVRVFVCVCLVWLCACVCVRAFGSTCAPARAGKGVGGTGLQIAARIGTSRVSEISLQTLGLNLKFEIGFKG